MQLKFSTNPNGKLFADIFGDIRPADAEKFAPGSIFEIQLGKDYLGKAEVIGWSQFDYKRMTDTLAHMNCGRGAAYQNRLLKNYYPNIDADSKLIHIIFKYRHRVIETQERLLQLWWNERKEQFPMEQSLFNESDFL